MKHLYSCFTCIVILSLAACTQQTQEEVSIAPAVEANSINPKFLPGSWVNHGKVGNVITFSASGSAESEGYQFSADGLVTRVQFHVLLHEGSCGAPNGSSNYPTQEPILTIKETGKWSLGQKEDQYTLCLTFDKVKKYKVLNLGASVLKMEETEGN